MYPELFWYTIYANVIYFVYQHTFSTPDVAKMHISLDSPDGPWAEHYTVNVPNYLVWWDAQGAYLGRKVYVYYKIDTPSHFWLGPTHLFDFP